MFKPVPMQHVTLFLVREDAPAAALALAECGVFNPQQAPAEQARLPQRPGERYRALFRNSQRRLNKVLSHLELQPDISSPAEPAPAVTEEVLAALDEQLGDIWRECSFCQEEERRLGEETRRVNELSTALDRYQVLDIDLGLLHGNLRFLDVHVGTVARTDVTRLREAVSLTGYTLTVFQETDAAAHVVVAGLAGVERDLNTVLDAASFHRLELPPEFRSHPSKLREELAARRQRIDEGRACVIERVTEGRRKYGSTLLAAAATLRLAAPYAALADVLHSRGALSQMSGWVPKDRVGMLRARMNRRLDNRFVLQARDPAAEERLLVPSALRHPWLVRPFSALVKNYGVPRYGEIDPTWLFAVTFVAMFGMMFGDVGHGGLIALAGVLLRQKIAGFAPFVVAVGLSSVAFGFLYGSVFGYEEIIHALWMSPLQDPILMLKVAFAWGVGFILLATAITIRNRLAERQFQEALLDGRGLAGAAMYVGVLCAGYRWVRQGDAGIVGALAVVVPLGIVLAYKWHEFRAPAGERVLVVLIEGFETLMSYVANTLSFLRVAAFSLNHVALAVAVFTLADMMNTTGHWITVVLGNLFILVLEGAIVAIQVLRLEYYEGFSRFFSGDGREFRPLILAPGGEPLTK